MAALAISQLPMSWLVPALVVSLASLGFYFGRLRAEQVQRITGQSAHSRPNYHAYFVALWSAFPALLIGLAFLVFGEAIARSWLTGELPPALRALPAADLNAYLDNASRAAANGIPDGAGRLFRAVTLRYAENSAALKLGALALGLASGLAGMWFARRRIATEFRARNHVESGLELFLFGCAGIAIATTVGIIGSLLFESLIFFREIPILNFLTGTQWNAQAPVPGPNDFGVLPLFFGTFMIALIAMLVAAPIGLYAAIYLSEYARPSVRAAVKPILEILAGIPTVVYGFFAAATVAPLVRVGAEWINLKLIAMGVTAEPLLAAQPTSALAAGLVMGVMVIPFVSSLSDDVINAVPQTLRDAAYAMGATKSETVRQVVLPAALPGIIAALLLAVSRAIGETMIVVMAAGRFARITPDPTAEMTTITVQIVSSLTGDSSFDEPKTLSAFALGLVLFIVTLGFNLIALHVVRKYREKYD